MYLNNMRDVRNRIVLLCKHIHTTCEINFYNLTISWMSQLRILIPQENMIYLNRLQFLSFFFKYLQFINRFQFFLFYFFLVLSNILKKKIIIMQIITLTLAHIQYSSHTVISIIMSASRLWWINSLSIFSSILKAFEYSISKWYFKRNTLLLIGIMIDSVLCIHFSYTLIDNYKKNIVIIKVVYN